jgi:hypothetical protein
MDITLKKIKVAENRVIFAVECLYCKSLANEFNANDEPVCCDHAEQSVHPTGGTLPDLREVVTLEDCTDIEHQPNPPTSG